MTRRASFLLSLLALSGCVAVGPAYVKPDPAAPQHWRSMSTAPANVVTTYADVSVWWQQLNDPLLDSLIQQGLQNSPDIRAAQAKWRESRARRALAAGDRFPTLDVSVSGSRNRNSRALGGGASSNLFSAGLDAHWEPDVFGGLSRALEAADADLKAARADLHGAQVSLAAEIALNYIELRSAQARLGIARDNLQTQGETLQITDWRQQAGLATELEVEQARANLEQTRATIPTLQVVLDEAEYRLAILLGQAPGEWHQQLAQPAALPNIPERVAIGIPADALRQRPDLRAAERRLAAETARIGEQKSALYPQFTLSGTFGWKAGTLSALGGPGTVASALAGSMAQTLFDAGRIRSLINIQTALQEQALAIYEKTVLTALDDVENALTELGRQQQRISTLRNARDASRNAARLARQQYESGLVDFQKVLDTQRTLLTIEDNLASSEAASLTALISLYKAIGGGWQEAATPSEKTTP